jgi:TRAP-type C4-dicarboxylate transport system substrate-binding protein
MSIARTLAVVAFIALPGASAAAQPVTLDLVNEYPASAMSSEADAFFAAAVERRANGRVTIHPIPDAKSGLRSREQLKAVSDNRYAMANSVAGTLGDEDPAFLLSSLPFLTATMTDARILYELALPLYEQLFAERKQKLLYAMPWPPSGIWSAAPLDSLAALKALKIRTYDDAGTNVLARIATSATIVSFSDLTPKLESGEINAVLSSGDGGAGRQLWKYLRRFSSINYAVPLSFASISLAAWETLDEDARAALTEAARETAERQWTVLATRLDENFRRMRANGVTIDEKPPVEVMDALRAAADASIADWLARAGPQAKLIYETYRKAR